MSNIFNNKETYFKANAFIRKGGGGGVRFCNFECYPLRGHSQDQIMPSPK